MRTLFNLLAKLLGIFLVFRPLCYMAYMLFLLSLRADARHESTQWTLMLSFPMQLLALLLGLILIFKTERIAAILKIPHDTANSIVIDSDSVLRIGLLLIGFYVVISAVPTLIGATIFILQQTGRTPGIYQDKFWTSLLQTVLGICLILQAPRLAEYFNTPKTA